MKISHLGTNIQTIRKFRGMKQQEMCIRDRDKYYEPAKARISKK